MKKFLVVFMALLFATGAFAQEAEKKAAEFKYGFFGIAYGVMGAQDDLEYDYTHIRVRPMFSLGNENVKGVVRLEIDQDYGFVNGAAAGDPPANNDAVGADLGTDNKVAEVKWAYIDVNNIFDVQNLSLSMGLKAYFFPLVMDNDAAMTQAAFDFGMGKAILSYIKVNEDTFIENDAADVDQNTDAQVYALDVPIKAGAITVRPGVMFFQAEDLYTIEVLGTDVNEVQATNVAINVNGEMGALGFDFTAAYLTGSVTAVDDVDIAAYGLDAEVTFKAAEGIKVGLFGTYTTGQDTSDDVTAYDAVMDLLVGAPDGRLFLVEANGVAANGGHTMYDQTDSVLGQMNFGLMVEAVMGKATILAQYGYCSFAEDNAADEAFIGHEVDLGFSYAVAPATTFFVELGYLTAGDDSINEEAAYEAAFGLKTNI